MLLLNRYTLALVLWLTFLFNIERLHINKTEFIDIAAPIYVLAVALVVVGLVLPQWQRMRTLTMQLLALLLFVIIKLFHGRPYWGDGYTYLTLFELSATLITITLAQKVGSLSADFVGTVRTMLFSDLAGRVYASDEAELIVKREMQHSRRRNRPLSVLVVEAGAEGAVVNVSTTAREIERLLAKRYSLEAMTRLLAGAIRRTDFILDQTGQGRLVLVTPEMRKEQAGAVLQRLNDQTQKRLGVTLRCGVASFPDQGITFEELIDQAERDLRGELPERRGEVMIAPAATQAEELTLVTNSTIGSGAD